MYLRAKLKLGERLHAFALLLVSKRRNTRTRSCMVWSRMELVGSWFEMESKKYFHAMGPYNGWSIGGFGVLRRPMDFRPARHTDLIWSPSLTWPVHGDMFLSFEKNTSLGVGRSRSFAWYRSLITRRVVL